MMFVCMPHRPLEMKFQKGQFTREGEFQSCIQVDNARAIMYTPL